MCNELPEAGWELRRLLNGVSGESGRYALAWALFHSQAYNDAIRIASSIRDKLSQEDRATRVLYLLYPPAHADLVRAAAFRYRVEPALALAVMREESHFREDAVSVSDARGLMQILPSTGEWLAGKLAGPGTFEPSALFVPSVNIEMGSYYLRYLLDKFGNNMVLAVAAYNWGETNLRRWLGESPPNDLDVLVESIPADETRKYVKKVLRSYAVYNSLYPPDFLTVEEFARNQ
jgi:soluble lytic murein transglycosylase-like protein